MWSRRVLLATIVAAAAMTFAKSVPYTMAHGLAAQDTFAAAQASLLPLHP